MYISIYFFMFNRKINYVYNLLISVEGVEGLKMKPPQKRYPTKPLFSFSLIIYYTVEGVEGVEG